MFPNNPNYFEKLVQAKQADIRREIEGLYEHQVPNGDGPVSRASRKRNIVRMVLVGAVLIWVLALIL